MDFLLCSSLVLLIFFLFLLQSKRSLFASGKLPPGPPGWPVVGNMFQLGSVPHATLARMKKEYGPVIWLRLGSVNTMVVGTAEAAADLFKNHDVSFADRRVIEVLRVHDYHKSTLAFAPYGAYWRMIRRLCSMEIFVNRKINETVAVRQKCVGDMLSWIGKEADDNNNCVSSSTAERRSGGIQVAHLLFLASFNMFGNMIFSRDLVQPGSETGSEFFTALEGVAHWPGRMNLADLFEWLKPFDLQGLKRNMGRDLGKMMDIISGFVKERLRERQEDGEKTTKDLLDVLLDFEGKGGDEPKKLSEHNIVVSILDMFMAGTETTSTTVEWALAELLRNPEKMIEAKAEIHKIIGPNDKFEENHVENLPFLQAIVKETLRLHPPVAFLAPRSAVKDTQFMGFNIPKKTQVWINAWAIGRDPQSWENPLSFMPERFLGSKTDYKGQHFEFIPFGAGRRICIGLPLADRMLHLLLGSLLHKFDWELEDSVTSNTIDMTEKMGLALRKLEPLKVIPRKPIVV